MEMLRNWTRDGGPVTRRPSSGVSCRASGPRAGTPGSWAVSSHRDAVQNHRERRPHGDLEGVSTGRCHGPRWPRVDAGAHLRRHLRVHAISPYTSPDPIGQAHTLIWAATSRARRRRSRNRDREFDLLASAALLVGAVDPDIGRRVTIGRFLMRHSRRSTKSPYSATLHRFLSPGASLCAS